ncbi:hypothetical protein DsansV1_C07g0069281 [Dioscorea sansibarensis]
MGEKMMMTMMKRKKKKTATVRGRAWRLIRITLIWARKGGAFKKNLLVSLKLAFKNMTHHQKSIRYFEREFSFDETPSFRFKLHRPRIPCISFPDDHDQDDDATVFFFSRSHDNNVISSISYDHHKEVDDDGIEEEEEQQQQQQGGDDDEEVEQLEGIDSQAEEFIAKFYQEMKLQRQVSLIQYNDMLLRSIS